MIVKRLFLVVAISLLSLSLSFSQNSDQLNEISHLCLPKSFPISNYTPHGYIDNPYHTMVHNRSGVIRSVPPLGFGYWLRSFKGGYGGGTRGYVNYLSFLQISVSIDNINFIESEDFKNNDVELCSEYHTKHMMSYDWRYNELNFSLKYFLSREHTLTCLIEIENSGSNEKEVLINATNIYGLWETRWWGSDGLTANYQEGIDASISKIWAYGDVFALVSDLKSVSHKATGSKKQWRNWIRSRDMLSNQGAIVKGSGPIYNLQSYRIILPPKSKKVGLIYLCRGKSENGALNELKIAQQEALINLNKQLEEDEKFWSNCPRLEGDWPNFWKHGWVYDWETLRMNIRQPVGIFHHPWDAMQIHSPRVVLGETALDMLTFQYADPELAKDVIYGIFADALMPNVPCAREDGSVNMIGADGSECGTAPMWGFPFHVIQSIFASTSDTLWVEKLYPYLKAYLEWWLENRTDKEGWLHCNNSWESGQDGSRRFLVKGVADPAEFVRTVDVEASMAEAMGIMKFFALVAGKTEDLQYWEKLADQRIKNTQSMFVNGWFRDFDGRSDQPIILKNFYDAIMLAPITCGVATKEQVEKIKPMFQYFVKHPRLLEWPPGVFAFTEAAWIADEQMTASGAITNITNRVYARIDKRSVLFEDKNQPFSYRIPGVACEYWPVANKPPGGENYGWGATVPALIIRNIIGFREAINVDGTAFYLAPAIPEQFITSGKNYSITNLHYREITVDVAYEIMDKRKIKITLDYKTESPKNMTIVDDAINTVIREESMKREGKISFEGMNGNRYLIRFD
ncbi:MAG: hypothetical protein DRP89_04055 [Candidatus Neomarinimicrobiota bacterium]|nr:MAG: hypothetical protein DRP89_04055 [Candidatus Neomarinimicrobiota bacterium]